MCSVVVCRLLRLLFLPLYQCVRFCWCCQSLLVVVASWWLPALDVLVYCCLFSVTIADRCSCCVLVMPLGIRGRSVFAGARWSRSPGVRGLLACEFQKRQQNARLGLRTVARI